VLNGAVLHRGGSHGVLAGEGDEGLAAACCNTTTASSNPSAAPRVHIRKDIGLGTFTVLPSVDATGWWMRSDVRELLDPSV
jgi:hypothetical protein